MGAPTLSAMATTESQSSTTQQVQTASGNPFTIVINSAPEKKDDKPSDPEERKLKIEKMRAEIAKLQLENKKTTAGLIVDHCTLKTLLGVIVIAAAATGVVLGKDELIKVLSYLIRPLIEKTAYVAGKVVVDAAVSAPTSLIKGIGQGVTNELFQTYDPVRRVGVFCGLAGSTAAFLPTFYIAAKNLIAGNPVGYSASIGAGLIAAGLPYLCNVPGISSLTYCTAK